MVTEGNLGYRCRGFGMNKGGICRPCLPSVFEMALHASPFVPSQKTVETNEDESEDDKEDNADFGSFDQVAADVVDYGRVETVAKLQPVLIRNRQAFGLEGNSSKSVVDIFLQKLKRGINAATLSLKALHEHNNRKTYTDSTFCLMSATEGIEALSLTRLS
jgi:hypothetical protein